MQELVIRTKQKSAWRNLRCISRDLQEIDNPVATRSLCSRWNAPREDDALHHYPQPSL